MSSSATSVYNLKNFAKLNILKFRSLDLLFDEVKKWHNIAANDLSTATRKKLMRTYGWGKERSNEQRIRNIIIIFH